MSCEITLWIENPGLQSAQFLLLTWGNWAEDTEDEDNLPNLNSDDWVEGCGAGGSQRFERWERHNHDGWNGEYHGAQLFQEWEHWKRGNGREWLTSRRAHSGSFGKKDFWSVKNWLGFTSPSLFYPARRSYKQYNKFVTVAAPFLSADGMYRTRRRRKNLLWNEDLSARTLERPSVTSADGVQRISVKLTFLCFIFFFSTP